MTSQKNELGVYYSPEDYANFWRRITAWIIDLLVLSLLISSYSLLFFYFAHGNSTAFTLLFAVSLATCLLYLTVIKASQFSTLGFWCTKIQIVNLLGEKPSFWTMGFRFILLTLGPFELLIDLLWLTGEKTRQTLRDKYAGTYVIRKNAVPIGKAPIIQTRLDVLGWHLVFSEVDIPE